MKVTMKDIAKKLNVSINAVSIALNDKPGVSDEMRLLILKTADEMGYINEKRKYLSVFSKSNIAIMMQSYYADTGHFYSIVLRSIVEEAKSLGYFSIMNYFDDSNMELPECIVVRKVAGIVIVGKISDMNLNQLKQTGIPIVLVDFTSLYDSCDCVLTHNKQGGYMISDYVIQKGYRKIGFFGDLNYSLSFQDRFIGYKEALINHQIINDYFDDEYIKKYSFLENIEKYIINNQIDEVVKILKSKELPDVLICANDSNAFAVIKALVQMGLRVPIDIGVTGFDDTPLCEKFIPPLTTVQVQKEAMGKEAVARLVDRIQRKDYPKKTELLSVKIIERASVK
ncbi:LacI family DNA-binding transcriptional regulator [uncultured Thomasclavelia sp.]|uniref:LacI family DNA-binding transcriptional regulator n=1 Tax=uncultured Thomasclavelia sp. TaxID=3025759 RepID=UPI00262715D7|nr:LacI family DNA-binding transcriptional regulator [uncultured Thomasclavelia sp.]